MPGDLDTAIADLFADIAVREQPARDFALLKSQQQALLQQKLQIEAQFETRVTLDLTAKGMRELAERFEAARTAGLLTADEIQTAERIIPRLTHVDWRDRTGSAILQARDEICKAGPVIRALFTAPDEEPPAFAETPTCLTGKMDS